MLTNKLSGVIFDLDNTLVSSSLNYKAIKDSLGCPKESDALAFVDSLSKTEQLEANALLSKYEFEDAVGSKKLVGTDEILMLLVKLGIPCAIVTRNSKEGALLKIKLNRINIPIVLSREDHKPKPAPDALLYLAKYWNTAPENLLYVGDYLYDVQAAINANTLSCLVTHGERLSYANLADVVVNELTELSCLIQDVFSVDIT